MSTQNEEVFQIPGRTKKVILPSQFNITLREQNGDDDDIISRIGNSNDGTAVHKFLASIILDSSLQPGVKLNHIDISKWKSNDKYWALVESRIHSLGNIVKFKHTCSNDKCNCETPWEENLEDFRQPFNKTALKSDEEGYSPYLIKPYPNKLETGKEFTLSSNKKIKYQYKTGESESKLLAMKEDDISKNTELIIRNLEIFNGGQWIGVSSFNIFTSKDMSEIRKEVEENDPKFEGISKLTCPKCGNVDHISLLVQADFLFPREI